jgi:hypothetical protein
MPLKRAKETISILFAQGQGKVQIVKTCQTFKAGIIKVAELRPWKPNENQREMQGQLILQDSKVSKGKPGGKQSLAAAFHAHQHAAQLYRSLCRC